MRQKIAIYVHPAHGFDRHSMLFAIAGIWSESGIEVEVLDDPGTATDADIAFLHVDLTEVPEAYRRLNDHYPVVVNGNRSSIAKRVVSENLLTRNSDYNGPVVVKTDRNYGGIPEDRAFGRRYLRKPSRRRRLDRLLPRRLTGGAFATEYQVYESLGNVPRIVWHLDGLVVEKFYPDRDGELYCIRYWEFLGDRHINAIVYGPKWQVKAADHVKVVVSEPTGTLLERLMAWRRKFRMDYAKFDYVMANGRPVLLDINPTAGAWVYEESAPPAMTRLAGGIESFFVRARRATSDSTSRR